jgi:hypothetical protein
MQHLAKHCPPWQRPDLWWGTAALYGNGSMNSPGDLLGEDVLVDVFLRCRISCVGREKTVM